VSKISNATLGREWDPPVRRLKLSWVAVLAFGSPLFIPLYPLILASLGTHYVGDALTQYSLAFSLTLPAVFAGRFVASRISQTPLTIFIIEVALSICALLIAPILYLSLSVPSLTQFLIILVHPIPGVLLGMESLLFGRIMERLTLYLSGAFSGAILACSFLVPYADHFRILGFISLLHAFAALSLTFAFPFTPPCLRLGLRTLSVLAILFSFIAVYFADSFFLGLETTLFPIRK